MFLKKLLPTLHKNSIYEIDLEALKKKGIKGIITDLDNTLVEWDRMEPTPELIDWLNKLKDEGFKVIVVSNNNAERVSSFVKSLDLPYISRAKKPINRSFNDSLKLLNLNKEEVVMVGDQLFTDILGGNRMGIKTILVTPVASSDGFFTRFNRQLERLALNRLRKKGLITWEEN